MDKKLVNKGHQLYGEYKQYMTKKIISSAISGDYYNLMNKNKKKIRLYFAHFCTNYIKILKYLKYGFGYTHYDGENIDGEIEINEKLKKNFDKYIYFSAKKLILKWKYVNDYMIEYKKILDELKKNVNSLDKSKYKDINFSEEYGKILEAKEVEMDFEPILKEIKEINKNGSK